MKSALTTVSEEILTRRDAKVNEAPNLKQAATNFRQSRCWQGQATNVCGRRPQKLELKSTGNIEVSVQVEKRRKSARIRPIDTHGFFRLFFPNDTSTRG